MKHLLNGNVDFIIIRDRGVLSSIYDPAQDNKCGFISFTFCEKRYKLANIFVLFNQGMTPEIIRPIFKKFTKMVRRSFKIIEFSGMFQQITELYDNWLRGESEPYIEHTYYLIDQDGIQTTKKK